MATWSIEMGTERGRGGFQNKAAPKARRLCQPVTWVPWQAPPAPNLLFMHSEYLGVDRGVEKGLCFTCVQRGATPISQALHKSTWQP